MIRINLLPIKQDRRREAGRNQLLIGLGLIGLEIIACALFSMSVSTSIEAQRNKNSFVESEVNRIKKEISNHQQILNEIVEYEKRQAAIEGLQAARTGPVFMMLELSNMLSKGGRPSIDNNKYQEMLRNDPASGYDESWDYRRLWISEFTEKNKEMTIRGQAISHEDVAEFLRRVNLSDFFISNQLISTDLSAPKFGRNEKKDAKSEPVVHFEVKGKVRYH